MISQGEYIQKTKRINELNHKIQSWYDSISKIKSEIKKAKKELIIIQNGILIPKINNNENNIQ